MPRREISKPELPKPANPMLISRIRELFSLEKAFKIKSNHEPALPGSLSTTSRLCRPSRDVATPFLGSAAKSASILPLPGVFCWHSSDLQDSSSLQTSEGCLGAGLGAGGSTGTCSTGSSLCSSPSPSFLKETTQAHPGEMWPLQGDQMDFSHVLPPACKAQAVLCPFHALHQILLRFPTPNSSLLTSHSSVMLSSSPSHKNQKIPNSKTPNKHNLLQTFQL